MFATGIEHLRVAAPYVTDGLAKVLPTMLLFLSLTQVATRPAHPNNCIIFRLHHVSTKVCADAVTSDVISQCAPGCDQCMCGFVIKSFAH